MKKATFLLLIMMVTILFSLQSIEAEEFSFSDFTVSLEEKMVNEEQTIVLTKGGMNPFQTPLKIEGYHLFYNGVKLFGDHLVVYGYTLGGYDMRDYGGFVFVIDNAGDVVFGEGVVYEYGFNENIKNVYTYDNHLMIEIQQTRDNGYHVDVLKHMYLLYDQTFQLIAEHSIDDEVYEVTVEDFILLGRMHGGDEYDFGISSSGDLIWKDDYIGVENQGVYSSEVCLSFLNSVVLNWEEVNNNTCIDTVGTHYLEYNDEMLMFQIEPIIEGVEDGEIYYNPIMISFSGGYATLNGDSYANYEEITDIGHYQFMIEGINDYQKEIHFEVGAVVEGITNNTVYQEGVTISFTGEGYLNNQYITSPVTVEQVGEYILKIKGRDGYLESYYFEIAADEEEKTLLDFIQKVDVFVLGSVLIIGIVVVKKKR